MPTSRTTQLRRLRCAVKAVQGAAAQGWRPPSLGPHHLDTIFGARDAVLVDCLMTVREATAFADWIDLHDRQLTTIYITHGHGDHYSGLSVVLGRFSDARAVASQGTVEQMRNGSLHPAPLPRAVPRSDPSTITFAEPLGADHIELEGLPLEVIETGHTDTETVLRFGYRTWAWSSPATSPTTTATCTSARRRRIAGPNGSLPSTNWPHSTRPPWSPATRTRPRATLPRSWRSPETTSSTTEICARQAWPAKPIRRRGEPLSRLGQPTTIPDNRLRNYGTPWWPVIGPDPCSFGVLE